MTDRLATTRYIARRAAHDDLDRGVRRTVDFLDDVQGVYQSALSRCVEREFGRWAAEVLGADDATKHMLGTAYAKVYNDIHDLAEQVPSYGKTPLRDIVAALLLDTSKA